MTAGNRTPGHVEVAELRVRLGEGSQAFDAITGINLDIAPGSFVCVLGPSGCGKSTLLGALAGHLSPTQGTLSVDGRLIVGPDPERGLVFQQQTLFPWMKVIDNVAFGPKMKGVGVRRRRVEAMDILRLVGLDEFAGFYPSQLSGGMQQRAEIARVLINHPRVLLMDEPFGALDAQTRGQMQRQLLETWQKVTTTVVFVTHDIDEALFLADRVLVMSPRPGRIIADFALRFSRPRDTSLLVEPEFTALKKKCMELLGEGQSTSVARLSPLGANSAAVSTSASA
jgi:NitT/TauT family transport system ATP-binding protein